MKAPNGTGRTTVPPLVLLDSDGCALDSMDIKQKTVFAPAFIAHFDLEDIAAEATEAWEFVSLHSRTRGANRFVLLLRAMDILRKHPSPRARRHPLPDLTALRDAGGDTGLVTTSNLAELAGQAPQMKNVLAWSEEIDRGVHSAIASVSPYGGVPEVLAVVAAVATIAIVSQTPGNTLKKEWRHAGLLSLVDSIYGQYPGGKAAVLKKLTANHGDTDAPQPVIMIGDAPGDFEATRGTPVRFYPIIPGREGKSWVRFASEVLYPFINGDYTEAMQKRYVQEFLAALPEEPTWKKS